MKYCKGKYLLSTAAGDVLEFSEFNLRIKTDLSEFGPTQDKPALLPAGMSGMMNMMQQMSQMMETCNNMMQEMSQRHEPGAPKEGAVPDKEG